MIRHLAILRFSSLGDVAMTVPVVDALARTYPDLKITMVSRPYVKPLFEYLPENVSFFGADVKEKYDGVAGLSHLYGELKTLGIDGVADFHDVLRTKYLKLLFRLDGSPVETISKGRIDKYRLTTHNVAGSFHRLPSSFERYADVLRRLNFPVMLTFSSLYANVPTEALPFLPTIGEKHKGDLWIGIAPLAAHDGKVYPLRQMRAVIECLLAMHPHARIFIFGSKKECERLRSEWGSAALKVDFVVEKLKGLNEELLLINKLNVMVSMDSANMHLASLVGTPVVSIWGATHPYAGFLGYGQQEENVIQVDLPCRPCSIFGNKACRFGDYHCMTAIKPEIVVERVNRELLRS